MSNVRWRYLDSNKKSIGNIHNEICFYSASYQEGMRYFKYYLEKYERKQEWLDFINSLNILPKIEMKGNVYTADITKVTAFELFATLTLLRYMKEFKEVINSCLLNKDNEHYTRLQVLFIAHYYAVNTGHSITKLYDSLESILEFTYKKPVSRNIIQTRVLLDRCLHYTFNANKTDFYWDREPTLPKNYEPNK